MHLTHSVTLVVLAGGLGSRFGGDKQVAELPHFQRSIMELNILDAYAAGIKRCILIINEKVQQTVESVIIPRLPSDLDVMTVVQRIEDLPEQHKTKSKGRHKPWGTGHALWCARTYLNEPSILITADDYYGDNAFRQLVAHFNQLSMPQHNHCAMVGYPLALTLSDNGGVNRGICQVSDEKLNSVVEHLNIRRTNGKILGDTAQQVEVALSPNCLVSMTCWGITPELIPYLELHFMQFLESYDNDVRKEYYLPDCIQYALDKNKLRVAVYTATQPWFGMTYQQELQSISEKIYESRQGSRPTNHIDATE
ncbi:Conserved domain protein [Pseudoalteromonas luteoviolacea B = ATCC 29581]|nr:Conserved domain protein [Pseudoalteromonas luteoviolacea B = ATCC 29581]